MAQGKLTTTLTNVMATYYDKKFIEWEKELLRVMQFAQLRPVPGNNGVTVQFTGYRPLDIVTTALTEGANPANNAFQARSITATVKEWGAVAKMSKLLELTKLDAGLEEQVNLMADQAARTLDYQAMLEICRNGVWGICAVPKATNTLTVTLKSSASNSTTRFVAATHVSGGHSWVGAIATVVKDGNAAGNTSAGGRLHKYGYAGRISSYTSNSATPGDVWTVNVTAPNAACPVAFQSGDQIHIAGYAGQTAASVLSTTNIRMAQRDLVNNKAMPFGDGYYGALISPYPAADFKGDTTWVNANSYSNITELYKGEIGRWFGFRFVETTQPYRDSVTGVAASFTGGAMFHNLFFGRNAFGHTELSNGGKLMHVLSGADKSDPLDMNTLVGWKQMFANKAITAPHCVDVVTGATA